LRLFVCYFPTVGSLQIKDFPKDLHAKLRTRADRQGCSMSAYVIGVLERDLGSRTTREWLDSLKEGSPTEIASEDIVRIIHEGREERINQILGCRSEA
jgi:plasmid stability protein